MAQENERNRAVPHDTEDKNWWLEHGLALEYEFVQLCKKAKQINAEVNPSKTTEPWAPDLIVDNELADLKVQNTPFFTATRYKLDPRFTVTFNRKDYERYKQLYPQIVVYFWINWIQLTWQSHQVEPLNAIYKAPFQLIETIIKEGAIEHSYIHRRNDRLGNAKSSFLFDVRKFEQLSELEV